jgi:hypothetical protein
MSCVEIEGGTGGCFVREILRSRNKGGVRGGSSIMSYIKYYRKNLLVFPFVFVNFLVVFDPSIMLKKYIMI